MVQALQIAGQLDGGLTRTNFMLALRAIDMTHPYLLPGMRMHMDGNKDAYFVEGGIYQKWDSAKQAYDQPGQRHRPRRQVDALRLGPDHRHLRLSGLSGGRPGPSGGRGDADY